MNGSNFMQGWVSLAGSVATIALILTAFGLMLGIVKPADVFEARGRHPRRRYSFVAAPGILASLWSAIPLWQRIAIVVIGIGILRWQHHGSLCANSFATPIAGHLLCATKPTTILEVGKPARW